MANKLVVTAFTEINSNILKPIFFIIASNRRDLLYLIFN